MLDVVDNEVAIRYIRGKAAINPEAFGQLPAALKVRAFTASGIEDLQALARIRDMIAELPAGGDWSKIKNGIAAVIGGDQQGAKARAELLLRVNGFQAYSAGRYSQQQYMAVIFPYWRYSCMNDDRVRDGHKELDGKIVPADDPWWDTHYPPWEWGCRCMVTQLTKRQAEGLGGVCDVSKLPGAPAKSGYGFHPKNLTVNLDQVKEKYLPAEWMCFCAAMRKTPVQTYGNPEQTAWDWLWQDYDRKDLAEVKGLKTERLIARDYATGDVVARSHGTNDYVSEGNIFDVARAAQVRMAVLHNHPGGDHLVSPQDLATTLANSDACQRLTVVGETRYSVVEVLEPIRLDADEMVLLLAHFRKNYRDALKKLEDAGLIRYTEIKRTF